MRRQTIYSLEIAHRTKNDSKKAVCLCRIRPQQHSHWSLTIWRGMFSPSSSKQRVLLFTWMEITPAAAAQVRWRCSPTWYQKIPVRGPSLATTHLLLWKERQLSLCNKKKHLGGPSALTFLGIFNFPKFHPTTLWHSIARMTHLQYATLWENEIFCPEIILLVHLT